MISLFLRFGRSRSLGATRLGAGGAELFVLLVQKYVHVLGARESDESKGEREDTEGGEDEGACEGGERQREDGREAAATTRTPP